MRLTKGRVALTRWILMLSTFPMLVSDKWTLHWFVIPLIWHRLADAPMLNGRTAILSPWVLLRTSCPGHTFGLRASILVRNVVGRRCPN